MVHAGIYYPENSLKAFHCVNGRRLLKQYCEDTGVAYLQRGKLIVATNNRQESVLTDILNKSRRNGLVSPDEALRLLSANEAKSIEKNIVCTAAILSPATAVVDSNMYLSQLAADCEVLGVQFAYATEVNQFSAMDSRVRVHTSQDTVSFDVVVNAAGLGSIALSSPVTSSVASVPYFAKGNYYKLVGANPFSHLVYPVPERAGLGVHVTIDVHDQVRFGPDVQWLDILNQDDIDYSVDPERCSSFYAEIRKYWPDLKDGALEPDYSGVRPKINNKG